MRRVEHRRQLLAPNLLAGDRVHGETRHRRCRNPRRWQCHRLRGWTARRNKTAKRATVRKRKTELPAGPRVPRLGVRELRPWPELRVSPRAEANSSSSAGRSGCVTHRTEHNRPATTGFVRRSCRICIAHGQTHAPESYWLLRSAGGLFVARPARRQSCRMARTIPQDVNDRASLVPPTAPDL